MLFEVLSDESIDPHRYVRVGPIDQAGLADELAQLVRGTYIDDEAARDRLVRAAEELEIFGGDAVKPGSEDLAAAADEEADAVMPAPWNEGRPGQTDVQRSELAEIVASHVLDTLFDTVIPASRVATKEIPDQQSRGADILGLERTDQVPLTVVLSEVKGSTESRSPPRVVDDMADKLKALVTNRRLLLQELLWLRDHAHEDWVALCARVCAAFQLRRVGYFTILAAPILVRSQAAEGEHDRGVFAADTVDIGCPVRFITVVIDDDLLDFARRTYQRAREGEKE